MALKIEKETIVALKRLTSESFHKAYKKDAQMIKLLRAIVDIVTSALFYGQEGSLP